MQLGEVVCYTPVIPATQEAEVEGFQASGQPGELSETLL
jgi:hypothetical protein